jgi:hypothetical protein
MIRRGDEAYGMLVIRFLFWNRFSLAALGGVGTTRLFDMMY